MGEQILCLSLDSMCVLIAGLSSLLCSTSNVSILMLLDACSIIFQLISILPLSHCHICCPTGVAFFRCCSNLVMRCRTVWPTQMDSHPQHSSLYTIFDFSSLRKRPMKEGIQVFIFLVVNIICALVIARTFFCFLLISDCDCSDIEPARWVANCSYNHRASYSQPSSFCFCPP